MAKYEHLPIYRSAFEYLIYCENTVKGFSRYHKYTHGSDLRNTAREMVKLIIRANNSRIKTSVLEDLRICLEESKLILRICKELKAFKNFQSFEIAINQVTNISRQAEGWLKSMRQKESGPNSVCVGVGRT
ncbi:hypothetical protein MHK_006654 [Candidatus Magnetomorum sp. HK-1]|nr:hypothetical protein MHK_006654 [Candidatus Magnetomorum sp. HK-1]